MSLADDLKGLLAEEADTLVGKFGEHRDELVRLLALSADLSVRAAAGQDVASEAQVLRSTLADYKAIAALIVQRATDRLVSRGADVAGQFAAGVLRGFLLG